MTENEYQLIRPAESYADQIQNYRKVFRKKHQSLDGTSNLQNYEDPLKWIAYVRTFEKKETVPEGMVPADQFLYVRNADDQLVGMIQVRHELNASLALIGGHIGCSVLPKERRKGIATRMLKDILPYCRSLGLKQVLLTCGKDNAGSRQTILAAGGVYEGDIADDTGIHERYWIIL